MSTIYTAPHAALQHALFCYATGTDGAAAILLRGWQALVEKVVEEVAGDDWPALLADLDEWQDDGWNTPHRYRCKFEDGYMEIFTVTGNLPNDAPVPETPTEDMLAAVLKAHPGAMWGYAVTFAKDWRAAVAAHRAATAGVRACRNHPSKCPHWEDCRVRQECVGAPGVMGGVTIHLGRDPATGEVLRVDPPARCPRCKREGFLHATWCTVGMQPDGVRGGVPADPKGGTDA